MRLSDVMSATELHRYAEVALVLFMVAFAAVAIDVFRRKRTLEPLRYLPLDEREDDQ
ncbi:MAG TPA: hypothetical protein VKY73_04620 [Polyangiaceae bacterium]|nr:hypothetical protein [Polyangiaceae bacterium]